MGLIPVTVTDLKLYEPRVASLLPQGRAAPPVAAMASTGNITLSGIQNLDGRTGRAGQLVLVWHQTDATLNGLYKMAPGVWARDSANPLGADMVVCVAAGATLGKHWLRLVSDVPISVENSLVVFEDLGADFSVYDPYFTEAERAIVNDLDRGQIPLKLEWLLDKTQLRLAKIYKVLAILYRPSAANSVDGAPDRHERMSDKYEELYRHELNSGQLKTIDRARVNAGSISIVRR